MSSGFDRRGPNRLKDGAKRDRALSVSDAELDEHRRCDQCGEFEIAVRWSNLDHLDWSHRDRKRGPGRNDRA
jgi:hypothetical protein